ncbi:DNA-binding transcriptional LysR family regulator [Caulobacter rhizosphaerae]|jgi:DNA-binding transcriptional LysR family regulator|uniref:DNA-binding transcriptional LysR family regulator n=1 Tax=Caulobacter rhizosphaerae TaxID=2010972 RepID=A0ABU1MZF3_9CAUL|nr:LysR family transcriptional regulator [Caulobacter rhizosphaerae]MDR6531478.1 DNA-binding transcriptional LysR family regulator [Caulobacter rhizosphaerae]
MVAEPGFPTIDQLRVLLTVVETGSFTAAAKRLNRAVSAISYTVAALEHQLGIALFDREGSRTPVLTEAGAAVVAKASVVAGSVDDLRASVRSLLGGIEAEVTLVVDVMLPSARLVDAAQAFEAAFPTVKLRLHVEALSAVVQLVRAGVATVGVGGGIHATEPDLELIHIGDVDLIPVAAPRHPMALCSPVPASAARRHRQLILTVRTPFSEGPDVGVFAAEEWRIADLGAKHALLLAGVGWGNMPEPYVRDDLVAGRLVRLELPEATGGLYAFQAMYRTDTPPGPAAAWLIQRFADQKGSSLPRAF